jgi:hypothetical protein
MTVRISEFPVYLESNKKIIPNLTRVREIPGGPVKVTLYISDRKINRIIICV